VLLILLPVFSPVEPFVVELVFLDACGAGILNDVSGPGCRSADINVCVCHIRGVVLQPMAGVGGAVW
jgi:hypothetical protein